MEPAPAGVLKEGRNEVQPQEDAIAINTNPEVSASNVVPGRDPAIPDGIHSRMKQEYENLENEAANTTKLLADIQEVTKNIKLALNILSSGKSPTASLPPAPAPPLPATASIPPPPPPPPPPPVFAANAAPPTMPAPINAHGNSDISIPQTPTEHHKAPSLTPMQMALRKQAEKLGVGGETRDDGDGVKGPVNSSKNDDVLGIGTGGIELAVQTATPAANSEGPSSNTAPSQLRDAGGSKEVSEPTLPVAPEATPAPPPNNDNGPPFNINPASNDGTTEVIVADLDASILTEPEPAPDSFLSEVARTRALLAARGNGAGKTTGTGNQPKSSKVERASTVKSTAAVGKEKVPVHTTNSALSEKAASPATAAPTPSTTSTPTPATAAPQPVDLSIGFESEMLAIMDQFNF
ncbi:hypothetical protein HDV00_001186 [Rhizophlyctis rosea]|nr:hypothetical protein HDV00_001186 [Rhizophlyctis rosea]